MESMTVDNVDLLKPVNPKVCAKQFHFLLGESKFYVLSLGRVAIWHGTNFWLRNMKWVGWNHVCIVVPPYFSTLLSCSSFSHHIP